jgi:phage recombination protein Bet
MTESQTWSDKQKKLVFNTVAMGLSAADQALFEAVCLSSGLDPLRKEVYAVVRGGKMSIQTGIDGYLKLANQTKELNGMEVLFFDEHGTESEVWVKKTPPAACLVRVYRKGAAYPFTASCRFEAYSQNNNMWKKFPETMLAKATTTLALRRGFADVISGIASSDELSQAGLAAPELLTQGTPEERPLAPRIETPKPPAPGTKVAKPPATPKAAPAVEAVKEFKGSSEKAKTIDESAQALAAATKGAVIEAPVEEAPKAPGQEDLQAVGMERGLTTFAIDGILGLIKGNFEAGIKTIQEKSDEEIAALNKRFTPEPAGLDNW